jgi:signal transduction histidine kinase
VVVDVVVVGDAPLDGPIEALVQALSETMTNSAKHSGAPSMSVYAEVEEDSVTAYVRDQGHGFDVDGVLPDRGGIAHSIRGRVERHGGTVSIVSEPGAGTEVQLTMPRKVR